MSEPDPQQTALYLIGELLDELPDDAHLYQLDLHKLLYKLQTELDDDNQVANALPFYWYLHGPVSETAHTAGNTAARTGIANREETEEGVLYSPGTVSPPEPSLENSADTDLDKAVETLSEIVTDYNFYEVREYMLEEEIYTDAPYRFQPEFKFQTLPRSQRFAKTETINPDVLITELHRAESKLPLDDAFDEFNTHFSRFVSLADCFLSQEPHEYPLLKGELAKLADISWNVFCKLLRYETAGSYYADKQTQWEKQATQAIGSYKQNLQEFEDRLIDANQYESDTARATEDEIWPTIAESILNGN